MNNRISRRSFLKKAGTLSASVAMSQLALRNARAASGKKTNVVLFMADDLGYECLSCYGSESYSTPVLDKLAQKGVRFTNAHANPLCTPSRVKIMTGKSNLRNYISFGRLKPGEKTFGHLFKQNGYATCCAGKWQLNKGYDGQDPKQAGFDEHCLWQVNIRGSRYADPTFTKNGEEIEKVEGKYGPDIYSDFCLDFIERKKEQPFFVYYPMTLTHAPFEPTPDSEDWPEKKGTKDAKYFTDMVAYMDKIVGKFVDKLEELGQLENTLIIFTGDNGTPRSITTKTDHGIIEGGKGHTDDYGTHVPLIAYWKNHSANYVCDDLVDFSDMMPTIAETAGFQVPQSWNIDGISFLPQIKGHKGNPKDHIFIDFDAKQKKDKWEHRRYVFDANYKLYDNGEFYNVKKDPGENKPLKDSELSKEAKKIKTKFRKVLDKYKGMKSPDFVEDKN